MASPLYGPAPQQNPLAQALLQQGSSTAPVQSMPEGIFRALTGAVGGFLGGNSDRQYREGLASALKAGQGWKSPDNIYSERTGEMVSPAGQVAPGTGGTDAMVAALMGTNNPQLANLGLGLQLQGIQNQSEYEKAANLERLKAQLNPKPKYEPVLGQNGQVIGQREVNSGKVESDPRYQGAQSSVAKIQQDLMAGLISPEQAAAAIKKETEGKEQPGMFGTSAEGRSLDYLVQTGVLTPQQAANWAAGKTATGPGGEVSFVTPNVLAQTSPGTSPPGVQSIRPRDMTFNDTQGKAAGFADRMAQSEGILATVDKEGTNWLSRQMEGVPGGNYLQSNDYQKFEQARRDFINAQLRRESGAVISPEEFANAEKQYFPRPGDKPDVIEQKRKNRAAAMTAMQRDAGPAYKGAAGQPTSTAAPRAFLNGRVITVKDGRWVYEDDGSAAQGAIYPRFLKARLSFRRYRLALSLRTRLPRRRRRYRPMT